MKIRLAWAAVLFGLSMVYAIYSQLAVRANSELREVLTRHITMVLRARTDALLTGDDEAISRFYDTETRYGRWALDHETRRIKYVKAWSAGRGIRFTGAESNFRIQGVESRGDSIWVYLTQDIAFRYSYGDNPCDDMANVAPNGPVPVADGFKIGTRHTMEFVNKNGTWLIKRDWYTDPLDEDTLVPEVRPADRPDSPSPPGPGPKLAPPLSSNPPSQGKNPTTNLIGGGKQPPAGLPSGKYNREAAVAYADKYWHEYNPKYKDCTGNGGDCTNFVSQVLGDPEAGGLSADWTWYYRCSPLSGGGSKAWVQTESFASYLLYSGRARRVARGGWHDVIQQGALEELQKGDLIGYEEKGRIEHFAIVTGRDSRGYVLVNSHTADRYHVPWDLGWDRQTIFWLLHITE
ncbi:MAG: amidase domain-containing protein [Firmicutes bacterium]|nr:amidase domain-containing protein [Bacillota bacterium]